MADLKHLCHAPSGWRRRFAGASQLMMLTRLGDRTSPDGHNDIAANEWPPVTAFCTFSSVCPPVYAAGNRRCEVCCPSSEVRHRAGMDRVNKR